MCGRVRECGRVLKKKKYQKVRKPPSPSPPSLPLHPNDRPGEEDRPFLPRFLFQKFSSRIVRSSVSLPTNHSEKLQKQRVRFYPSKNRRLSLMQSVRTLQFRGAPKGAPVPAGTGPFQQIQLAVSTGIYDSERDVWKWELDVAGDYCPRVPNASASSTIPAKAPFPRAYPRSQPIRSSPLSVWKSPHQVRLALPQEGRAHRVCPCHVPGNCCRAKHQGTVHQSDTLLSQRRTNIIRARCVLACTSAAQTQLARACLAVSPKAANWLRPWAVWRFE